MSIFTPEQTLASLEHRHLVDKIKQRKLETRKKIEWGGLVVKSKMHLYSKEIILGSLIDAEEKMRSENGATAQNYFSERGKKAFSAFSSSSSSATRK